MRGRRRRRSPVRRPRRRDRPGQNAGGACSCAFGSGRQSPEGPPFAPLVASLVRPPALKDETLQNPRCVFQIVKRHFARYTPEMVEKATGCPKETFLKVAETILANSGADRTTSFAYAVAWTQHTYGVQIIGACALLQLLLGNIGRPGAGVMALRGHASIQGSTDIPTLYHSIQGYLAAPTALKKHDTLQDYIAAETIPTGYWANMPKFMVSYLKSMYGDAATKENQFGYDWHPKILGDHSHMAMFAAMNAGKVKGMICVGQNPATSLNAKLERAGLRKLEWLVVKDNWITETANYWKNAPEIKNGEVKTADIKTEVFYLPATQVAELEGTFTNTQRLLQFHHKAAEAPGDCRSDTLFSYDLGKRLKKLYANSTRRAMRDGRIVVWDYEHEDEAERKKGEPSALKILKEINGFFTEDPSAPLRRFRGAQGRRLDDLRVVDLLGCLSRGGKASRRQAHARPAGKTRRSIAMGLGMAGEPARDVQPRVRRSRREAVERKEEVGLVGCGGKKMGRLRCAGLYRSETAYRQSETRRGRHGRASRHRAVYHAAGRPRLAFVPAGSWTGRYRHTTNRSSRRSPIRFTNSRRARSTNTGRTPGNELAKMGDPKFPYVLTTYRLTEHYLAGGMSRWLPWLTELQPELFVEISPELAQEKGIKNLDWCKISSPRTQIRAKALVTRRMQPFKIDGKVIHQVGMPWHWGYEGISKATWSTS